MVITSSSLCARRFSVLAGTNDLRPPLDGFLDVDVLADRCVLTVVELDNTGNFHKIDTGLEIEGARNLRSRDDEYVNALEGFYQGMGDGAATSEMAKTERVMAVHQDAHMGALMLTVSTATIARGNASGMNMLVQATAMG
jgi:hypothetical protein